jgi:hypothetical protein
MTKASGLDIIHLPNTYDFAVVCSVTDTMQYDVIMWEEQKVAHEPSRRVGHFLVLPISILAITVSIL